MKTIATIIIVCFSTLGLYSQDQLELSILKGTEKPNTETEHFYLLEIKNKSNKISLFNISALNKACRSINSMQTDLIQEVFNKEKSRRMEQINIQPGKSIELFIKISRPKNSKLNTWNCTEVKAVSAQGTILSNVLTIESLIQDPKNVN